MYASYKINNEIKFSYPLISVKGGLPHLQDLISQQLLTSLRKSSPNTEVLVVRRFSSDIMRFVNSIEMVDKGITYAGLSLTLTETGFDFVMKVEEPGQYSRQGDSISFWPIGYERPIRAEFFDDTLESMVSYDELYGRKYSSRNRAFIGKADILDDKVEWANLLFPSQTKQENSTLLKFDENFKGIKTDSSLAVCIFTEQSIDASLVIDLELSYPNLLYSRFDIFEKELNRLESSGYRISIRSSHKSSIPSKFHKHLINEALDMTAGFVDCVNKNAFFTDRELFGTIYITKEKKKALSSRQARNLLSEIEGEIELGDYIVHEDHGVGIYAGITREKDLEYLSIRYAEGDELLVPLDKLSKVTKYIGVSNRAPEVTRLHKGNWNSVTEKTKKGVNIIARELVQHYAKLELAEAPFIREDSDELYEKFVEKFLYEETQDQQRTIDEVLKDLAQTKPMNRLIVGDVGFGKTEVAMRAAFKVVQQGLQVAVLAPTTVLTAQHFKVFTDRFAEFEVQVAMMSRFTGKTENSDTARKLKKKEVDIVIGTHRLLSDDIQFSQLGLIIIDEEQKFGVRQKEKLKKLKYGAHVLSMTATPIPRTLSMALSQIQDISIITTPPKNRKVIETEVGKINWDKIVEAVRKEVSRGGQVYFIHNRVKTIDSTYHKLKTLLPEVRFVVGHGQLSEVQLERVMSDFYNKRYDCLICTTIIENGIDMPNVNTIIIDKAQNFGLGQLYQLRGRVGRGSEQAYAFLFYDGVDVEDGEDNSDSEEKKYIARLKAVLEAQELGAGFKIASRDLEIRGAGNLLGKEQHGQISKVGLALYMQMLAEEIERTKMESRDQSSSI